MSGKSKTCKNCNKLMSTESFKSLKGEYTARAWYCETCQPIMKKSGARDFEFSESVKRDVIGRQHGLCADCGSDATKHGDVIVEFHHVIPNQAGNSAAPSDAFIRTEINCVMLCEDCHTHAHSSNYATGTMCNPDSFVNSHGGDRGKHSEWVKQLSAMKPSTWS